MKYERIIEEMTGANSAIAKLQFRKKEESIVRLYFWENGALYEAPYKCLSAVLMDFQEIANRLDKRFSHAKKVETHVLFMKEDKFLVKACEAMEIRALSYMDEEALNSLRLSCEKWEQEEVDIQIYDAHIFGVFKQGILLGACSVQSLHEAGDIAILVHPMYRRQGIAGALLQRVNEAVVSEGGICVYRCDGKNIASRKCAEKWGFQKRMSILEYTWEG